MAPEFQKKSLPSPLIVSHKRPASCLVSIQEDTVGVVESGGKFCRLLCPAPPPPNVLHLGGLVLYIFTYNVMTYPASTLQYLAGISSLQLKARFVWKKVCPVMNLRGFFSMLLVSKSSHSLHRNPSQFWPPLNTSLHHHHFPVISTIFPDIKIPPGSSFFCMFRLLRSNSPPPLRSLMRKAAASPVSTSWPVDR